jgi:16S rRNA (guanine966-N2)-methyltransferase
MAGARVLDLYAGSGALGIEALSRGAASVVAVEQDRTTARTIADNASLCGLEASLSIEVAPVLVALSRLRGRQFDLVFLDPPYGSGEIDPVLAALAKLGLVAPGGWIVVEHGRRDVVSAPRDLEVDLERRYGDSLLTLLTRSRTLATDPSSTSSEHEAHDHAGR